MLASHTDSCLLSRRIWQTRNDDSGAAANLAKSTGRSQTVK